MKPPVAEIEAAKIFLDERKRKAQEVLSGSKPWWFVWLYVLTAPISANLASQGWFNTSEQTVNFLAVGMSTWLVAALCQVWYLSRHLEAAIELIKLNDERQSGR